MVGCGSYECAGTGSRSAKVAFTVADDVHRRGVGTLLLRHLILLARVRGVRAFTAETPSENWAVLRVFAGAGLPVRRPLTAGYGSRQLSRPTPACAGCHDRPACAGRAPARRYWCRA